MPDKEKVIKGIESCEPSVFKRICMNCPYKEEMNCDYVLYHDVIALLKEQEERIKKRDESVEKAQEEIKWLRKMLKEQEAMKPISKSRHGANPQIQHFCRRCNAMLFRHKQKYCIECGQAVKWE